MSKPGQIFDFMFFVKFSFILNPLLTIILVISLNVKSHLFFLHFHYNLNHIVLSSILSLCSAVVSLVLSHLHLSDLPNYDLFVFYFSFLPSLASLFSVRESCVNKLRTRISDLATLKPRAALHHIVNYTFFFSLSSH